VTDDERFAADGITHLEDWDVIAVAGEGVWVVGPTDSCWSVAGDQTLQESSYPLGEAYRTAVSGGEEQ
jgi:hypothetical protein